jgi:hypothetical protein
MARMTKAEITERDEHRAKLRELLTPGQVIYTADVSGPNSSRALVRLHIAVIGENGRAAIRDITQSAAKAMGEKITWPRNGGEGGIAFGGWGYSKEFQAVYALGRALYPDGVRCAGDLKSKPKCRSNDHVNGDPKGYSRAKGHVHADSGYTYWQQAI